jgi:hypothetical protein
MGLLLFLSATCSSFAQLSGTYRIGGANPGFSSFTDAVAALETNGVSRPVTFRVASGTYNEQVRIGPYPGNRWENQVTFAGDPNDSTAVPLAYQPTQSPGYTRQINGANCLEMIGNQILIASNRTSNQSGVYSKSESVDENTPEMSDNVPVDHNQYGIYLSKQKNIRIIRNMPDRDGEPQLQISNRRGGKRSQHNIINSRTGIEVASFDSTDVLADRIASTYEGLRTSGGSNSLIANNIIRRKNTRVNHDGHNLFVFRADQQWVNDASN